MKPPVAPAIFVISGVQASGKSTVANLLARRFSRGVHIEADALQRMIVSGIAWPEEPGEPQGEAAVQLRLRLKNMCQLARSFFEAGFTVTLDDIILGERWAELQAELTGLPYRLVVLAPSVETVISRDLNRSKDTLGAEWAGYLDGILRSSMADIGFWLDTTNLSPEQTADRILAHFHPEL